MTTNPQESRFYEGKTTRADSRQLRPTRLFKLEIRRTLDLIEPKGVGIYNVRQQMRALLPVVALFVLGCSTVAPRAINEDLRPVFDGSYLAAQDAWRRVERTTPFEGKTRPAIIALIGAPDFETADAICYKTAAGPLWIEFDKAQVIGCHLVSTPPHWRGTQEEAEAWWKKTRDTKDWYAY